VNGSKAKSSTPKAAFVEAVRVDGVSTAFDRAALGLDDTTMEARALVFESLRAMSEGERLLLASRMSVEADQLRLAGLRDRHPEASESELLMRLRELKYGSQYAAETCGWTAR
jgi:hypothetical protein